MTAGAHNPKLTEVQIETWRLFAQGVPAKTIAIQQERCIGAIEQRLRRVCDALGVETRLGLIKAALEHGLIEHGEVPEGKPKRCPCCGDTLPTLAMRVLVESYHGHGYKAVARRLGISLTMVSDQFAKLHARFGGRGAQHYVAAAIKSGLMRTLLNELGTTAARDAANGGRDAHRPAVGGAEVSGRERLQAQGRAVRAEPATAVHHGH